MTGECAYLVDPEGWLLICQWEVYSGGLIWLLLARNDTLFVCTQHESIPVGDWCVKFS